MKERSFLWRVLLILGILGVLVASNSAVQASQGDSGELFVSARAKGVQFTATAPGVYRFQIKQGAYISEPLKHPQYVGRRTLIFGYKNRPIQWSRGYHPVCGDNPGNSDYSLGDGNGHATNEEAEAITRGKFVDIKLYAGEYVIWVIDDSRNCFSDNAGGIYLAITKLASGMIVNIGSGRCLTAHADGNPVTIADCNSSTDQIFIQYADDTIRVLGGSCMDTASTCERSANQLYTQNPDDTSTVSGDVCQGTVSSQVTVRGCDGRETQKWTLNKNGLLTSSNGSCADVQGRKLSVGAPLMLSSCKTNKQSKLFKLIPLGTTVAQGLGGVGAMCEGAPKASAGRRQADGKQRLYVSVGSIAHDNCCLKYPDGVSCKETNSNNEWGVPCKAEWEKALRNTYQGRQWRVTLGEPPYVPPYSITNYTDDLTFAPAPNRQLGLPTADTFSLPVPNSKNDSISVLQETVSTRRFAAPSGTQLDWYDVEFCQSQQATYDVEKGFITCK